VTASMPSATYRFHIAAPTVDANVAMAPCPILPDRQLWRRFFPPQGLGWHGIDLIVRQGEVTGLDILLGTSRQT
jgi:hypothetical protein